MLALVFDASYKHRMKNRNVFIDESGDAGLTGRSLRFVMVCVVVGENNRIGEKMLEYKRALGWRSQDEFKFSRMRKEIAKELLKLVRLCDYEVYGVVFDKSRVRDGLLISTRYSLYNYALVELLKLLSEGRVKICIDGCVGKRYEKNMKSFLRKELGGDIIVSLKYANSKAVEELQLADVVAGSIGRVYSGRGDAVDYVRLIRDKIIEIKEI